MSFQILPFQTKVKTRNVLDWAAAGMIEFKIGCHAELGGEAVGK